LTPEPLDPNLTDVSGSVPGGAAGLLGASSPKISSDDIEAKFRELADDVDVITNDVRSVAVTAAAVGLAVVVVVAFWLGRRRGKRGATVLEIRRV
jgi:hypothetical protein